MMCSTVAPGSLEWMDSTIAGMATRAFEVDESNVCGGDDATVAGAMGDDPTVITLSKSMLLYG